MPENTLFCYRADAPLEQLFDHRHAAWAAHESVSLDRDWRGRSMLREKGIGWKNLTQACSLWSEQWLVFRFDCWYDTLNLDPGLARDRPVRGLWEKDVVEIFIKPEAREDYFELEISPLGQWLDIHVLTPRVDVDYHWTSGMKLSVSIEEKERIWRLFAALPWESLSVESRRVCQPVAGEVWRLNLCRIAGEEPQREYLAWRPTFTPRPDFHVPSSFGALFFLEE